MANILGTGPVAFTTSHGGHVILPLSMVSYDTATSAITISNDWTVPAYTSANAAKEWVAYLLKEEELTVDTSPTTIPGAGGPAFVAEAVHPGDASHNKITLTIDAPAPANPPSATSYKLDVTVENTYAGLTLDTLADVIGTALDVGSMPGLVHLVTPPAPPILKPNNQTVNFTTVAPAQATLVGTGPATAFVLEAPGDGGGASSFDAVVSGANGTFDLKMTWTKSNTGNAASHATAFAYVLNISAPAGGEYGAPPAGVNSYTLTGGGDPGNTPIPATPPKATIPPV